MHPLCNASTAETTADELNGHETQQEAVNLHSGADEHCLGRDLGGRQIEPAVASGVWAVLALFPRQPASVLRRRQHLERGQTPAVHNTKQLTAPVQHMPHMQLPASNVCDLQQLKVPEDMS
jgi:hypothetical protein